MTAHSRIAGVLLAGGSSSRFAGGEPKQLAEFGGEPLVRRAAGALLGSALDPVIVVTGGCEREVRAVLDGLDVVLVSNPAWREGQAGSVRAGLSAVPDECEGACFAPCDQPFLDAATIDSLLVGFDRLESPIVVPRHGARRGAPVVFSREFFPEFEFIEGDAGGRQVMKRHADRVREVVLTAEGPLLDVDTRQDLERLRALL